MSHSSSVEDAAVVAELSSHLEDAYEELLEAGLSEPEAIKQALGRRANWRGLAKRIRRAKSKEDGLNHRTKTLWLPGLVSLTASMTWLMLLQRLGPQPRMPWLHAGTSADALSGVASHPAPVWSGGRLHVASRGSRTAGRTHREYVSRDRHAWIVVSGGSDEHPGREESACIAAMALSLVRYI